MARFLFIHQNFPGQFLHLAPALAAAGHEVRAASMRKGTPRQWQGVQILPYAVTHKPLRQQHPWLVDMETKLLRGQACLEVMLALQRQGWTPDVVVAHPGWGESLFVREVWPQVRWVMFGEFFYQARGLDMGFDPEFSAPSLAQQCRVRMRSAHQLLQLEAADWVLSPTHWQASTYPQAYRDKIRVIHDGVDTAALAQRAAQAAPALALPTQSPSACPQLTLQAGDELVTFVSRNLEPYRGYHSFMRALPRLLQRRPQAKVVLVGGDGVSYGAPPSDGRSWKQTLVDEVRGQIPDADWARVFFMGHLPYEQFLSVLRHASVHVYLTYPFVLSWSLIEAMALGCAVVASDTAPVREVIEHGRTGLLVDFFQPQALADTVAQLLANPAQRQQLGQAAQALAAERYDLHRVCLPAQMAAMVQTAEAARAPR